jgi:hypothetical protein
MDAAILAYGCLPSNPSFSDRSHTCPSAGSEGLGGRRSASQASMAVQAPPRLMRVRVGLGVWKPAGSTPGLDSRIRTGRHCHLRQVRHSVTSQPEQPGRWRPGAQPVEQLLPVLRRQRGPSTAAGVPAATSPGCHGQQMLTEQQFGGRHATPGSLCAPRHGRPPAVLATGPQRWGVAGGGARKGAADAAESRAQAPPLGARSSGAPASPPPDSRGVRRGAGVPKGLKQLAACSCMGTLGMDRSRRTQGHQQQHWRSAAQSSFRPRNWQHSQVGASGNDSVQCQ